MAMVKRTVGTMMNGGSRALSPRDSYQTLCIDSGSSPQMPGSRNHFLVPREAEAYRREVRYSWKCSSNVHEM